MTDTKKPDGGPAFPLPLGSADRPEPGNEYTGMSIRDYFAAAALQGILANPNWTNRPCTFNGDAESAAYAHADEMLAERSKP